MKAVLVVEPGLARCFEADRHLLRFEYPIEVDLVVPDPEAPFPAGELAATAADADATAWWWNSARTEEFVEAISGTPSLTEVFSDPAIRRHAVLTETHHRPEAISAADPWFDRLFVSHLNSIPAGEEDRIGWLPSPAFGLTTKESEALMVTPRSPATDLVFPFVPYFLGDRPQRLARIARITREMQVDFRRGLYVSELPAGFVHRRNYHNVLAAAKVALNLSVWRDLNQRLFEANLMGATVLSEWQPDHGRLAFDRANTFFFRADLPDFREALTAALAHEPVASPRLDIRNRHLTIHRLATILADLTGTGITVAEFDGSPQTEDLDDRRIEYVAGEGDREFGDVTTELLAMRCSIYNRIESCINFDAAFAHLKEAVALAEDGPDFTGIADDVLFLVAPLVSAAELAGITAANKIGELRAMSRAAAERRGDPASLWPRLDDIVRRSDDLSAFRAACRRELRPEEGKT